MTGLLYADVMRNRINTEPFLRVADNICKMTAVVAELSVCRLFTSAALIDLSGFLVGGHTDSSLETHRHF